MCSIEKPRTRAAAVPHRRPTAQVGVLPRHPQGLRVGQRLRVRLHHQEPPGRLGHGPGPCSRHCLSLPFHCFSTAFRCLSNGTAFRCLSLKFRPRSSGPRAAEPPGGGRRKPTGEGSLRPGGPRPTAAIPMDNPYCSCALTRVRSRCSRSSAATSCAMKCTWRPAPPPPHSSPPISA